MLEIKNINSIFLRNAKKWKSYEKNNNYSLNFRSYSNYRRISSCNKGNDKKNDKDNLESSRRNVGISPNYQQEPVTITVTGIKTKLGQNNKSSKEDSEDVIIEYDLSVDDGIRKGKVINESLVVTSLEIKAKDVKVGEKDTCINLVPYLVSGTCNPGSLLSGFRGLEINYGYKF